jgi:hypothetical protein
MNRIQLSHFTVQVVLACVALFGADLAAVASPAAGAILITKTGNRNPSFRFQESNSKKPAAIYAINVSILDSTRKVVCTVRRTKVGEVLPFEETWLYGTIPKGFESPMCSPLETGMNYLITAIGFHNGSLAFEVLGKHLDLSRFQSFSSGLAQNGRRR